MIQIGKPAVKIAGPPRPHFIMKLSNIKLECYQLDCHV